LNFMPLPQGQGLSRPSEMMSAAGRPFTWQRWQYWGSASRLPSPNSFWGGRLGYLIYLLS
jgi:hypothetical protein